MKLFNKNRPECAVSLFFCTAMLIHHLLVHSLSSFFLYWLWSLSFGFNFYPACCERPHKLVGIYRAYSAHGSAPSQTQLRMWIRQWRGRRAPSHSLHEWKMSQKKVTHPTQAVIETQWRWVCIVTQYRLQVFWIFCAATFSCDTC